MSPFALSAAGTFSEPPLNLSCTVGNKRSLALSRSGGVYSWGDGADGQLGHGDETHTDAPKLVGALARLDVAMVVAGASHSFALTADGAPLPRAPDASPNARCIPMSPNAKCLPTPNGFQSSWLPIP